MMELFITSIVSVNNAEQRGIAVATSKPMGRSAVRFPKNGDEESSYTDRIE